VGVYVDDLMITDTKDAEVTVFKEEMKVTFQMSDLNLLSFYLGIEVHHGNPGITLRQTGYVKHIVELARLTDCNPAFTLIEETIRNITLRLIEMEELSIQQQSCQHKCMYRPATTLTMHNQNILLF
jgi:hypothetical protein